MARAQGKFLFIAGQFKTAFDRKNKVIEQACFDAIKVVATTVKIEARANIAAAGFSSRWQNALRVNVYGPTQVKNPDELAAAWLYHKIPYSGIFERGGIIKPKGPSGFLWIPTMFAPKRAAGGRRMTPRLFPGKLFKVQGKNGNPILMSRVATNERTPKRRLTLKTMDRNAKRFAAGERGVSRKALPMFTGVRSVEIRKRFKILALVQRARAELRDAFIQNLKDG